MLKDFTFKRVKIGIEAIEIFVIFTSISSFRTHES